MHKITPDDARLLREYRDTPSSRHYSLDLQRLLTLLRQGPVENKTFIWYLGGTQFAIGQLGARRGDPFRFYDDRRFTNMKDAGWALLKIRWELVTGLAWPLETE